MQKNTNSIDELSCARNDIVNFIQTHRRTPRHRDYKGSALEHCREYYERIARSLGTSLNDFVYAIYLDLHAEQFQLSYNHYVEKYQSLIREHNCTLYDAYLYNCDSELLPDSLWMIKNCPITGVTNGTQWLHHYSISSLWTKQEVANLVMMASVEAGRQIMYEDFQSRRFGLPPVTALLRHWKSINAMNDDLGLARCKDCMSARSISDEDAISDFLRVCSLICAYRPDNVLTTREVDAFDGAYNCHYYRKAIKKIYGVSLPEFAREYGYVFGSPGNGTIYTFSDGEIAESQFERIFSEFLRKEGLQYNVDYSRSQTYSNITGKEVGYKRCDYVIQLGARKIIIEIAGMLSSYKKAYVKNIPILKSKSKEHYRQSLLCKESILMDSGFEYFILFPCDLTDKLMRAVLYAPYQEAKQLLLQLNKNNIDWTLVDPEVGVVYDWLNLGKDLQPVCLCAR